MRIAYIKSAYKCPRLLTRLVHRLHTSRSVFLIHVDKRTDQKQYSEMVFGLYHPEAVPVQVVSLACGGPDAVSNLQWQTVAAAKAKDRWELRACGH